MKLNVAERMSPCDGWDQDMSERDRACIDAVLEAPYASEDSDDDDRPVRRVKVRARKGNY